MMKKVFETILGIAVAAAVLFLLVGVPILCDYSDSKDEVQKLQLLCPEREFRATWRRGTEIYISEADVWITAAADRIARLCN